MSKKARFKKKSPTKLPKKIRLSTEQRSVLSQTIQTALQFHNGGNFRQAEEYYRQALAIDPTDPSANNLLGTLYYQTGNPAIATPFVEKAIRSAPDYVDAYNLLGSIHHAKGDYEKSIICYKKALSYNPDFAMAHNNLGIALEAQGRYLEALDCYKKALEIQPRYADAYANQGIIYRNLGRIDEAIASYCKALTIEPNFPDAWSNFSATLKLRMKLPDSVGSPQDKKNILINSLTRNDIETKNFFYPSFHELFQKDILEEVDKFVGSENSTESFLGYINGSQLSRLFSEQLFLLMLRKTVVTDRLAESFFTLLRRGYATLLATKEMNEQLNVKMLPVVCALANQCFLNEYVYQTTEAEKKFLPIITKQLQDSNSLSQPEPAIYLALLSCYAPLNTYDLAEDILEKLAETNDDLADLIRVQIVDAQTEKELFKSIRTFSEVSDKISQQVRQQYEENPYPRWASISLTQPKTFVQTLKEDLAPHSPPALYPVERPEILVAGCGTGRQPIGCAARYLNSSLVAIDLSRTSMAYAWRKANELKINNIEFLQGDILDLPKLEREFDIIICSGVLHHMRDPEEGLRSLVGRLKNNGYMQIGLYSEIARKHIVAARDFIKEKGFTPTIDDIRACRQALFALPDNEEAKLVTFGHDFYTTSTVRDLIFHVQEHRFTLPEISQLLEKYNLEFLGFTLDIEFKNAYLSEHKDDPNAISLGNWHQFEQEHPETFREMYNFWVRKKGF